MTQLNAQTVITRSPLTEVLVEFLFDLLGNLALLLVQIEGLHNGLAARVTSAGKLTVFAASCMACSMSQTSTLSFTIVLCLINLKTIIILRSNTRLTKPRRPPHSSHLPPARGPASAGSACCSGPGYSAQCRSPAPASQSSPAHSRPARHSSP